MAIPNPDHYLDQAEHLITWSGGRQVELRRAISTAYYGVFHLVMKAAADTYVGRNAHQSIEYAQAYRQIDHATLKNVCEICKGRASETDRQAVSAQYSSDLRAFAGAVVELQARRHKADYDPQLNLRSSDARAVVVTARSAIRRFRNLSADQRLRFLFLLMVRPKVRS